MHLEIILETERRREIGRVSDLEGVFIKLTKAANQEEMCCLRFLDPYGETVFNHFQMKALIAEIEMLSAITESPEDRDILDRAKSLANQCQQTRHLYMRFSGD